MSITMPATGPELRRAFVAPFTDIELRESRSGDGSLHLQGHAAVFDRLSHDLGGFRERIVPGAFRDVLDTNPEVHLVYNHDMSSAMASTAARTLELREDPAGLRVWAKLDPDDMDVKRIAPKMKRGDVRQMSFAFTVDQDDWDVEDPDTPNERVIRTIRRVGGLFDVSVVAQGAYPQTDANLRSVLDAAVESGRVPLLAARATPEVVAAPEPGVSSEPSHAVGGESLAVRKARARAKTAAFLSETGRH